MTYLHRTYLQWEMALLHGELQRARTTDQHAAIWKRASEVQERLLTLRPTWPTWFDVAGIWMRAAEATQKP